MFTTMVGSPYEICNQRDVICVTTNGEVKKNGHALMGQGVGQFVRDNFHGIDVKLGGYIKQHGNRAFNLGVHQYEGKPVVLVSFPTKHGWRSKSDLELISKSTDELIALCDKFNAQGKIYIPAPGCTSGRLKWAEVKPLLEKLDDRFVVYSHENIFTE